MATDRTHARRQLDARFEALRPLVNLPRPHRGWIRAIRNALGMSTTELADRLGVSQSGVPDVENSELSYTIKLETLQRVAHALDCELVYFLVPRTGLDAAVRRQAERKAAQHLSSVAHQSRLEDQAVTDDDTTAQLDELATRFIDHRGLWSEKGS
ncbi:MAG: mobile mystery protein A [Acidimicrobiia bacterium]